MTGEQVTGGYRQRRKWSAKVVPGGWNGQANQGPLPEGARKFSSLHWKIFKKKSSAALAEDCLCRISRYNLDLAGEPFAQGLADKGVEIPAMGSAILEVEAVSTTVALVKQLQRMGASNGAEKLGYRVQGVLHLGGRPRLPFDYQGEINLAGLLGRQ